MRKIQKTFITTGIFLFSSCAVISAMAQGTLEIQVSPPVVYQGSRVELTCLNHINRSSLPDTMGCHLWWSSNVVLHSATVSPDKIEQSIVEDNTSWPLSSTLVILSMDRDHDGMYTCTLTCGPAQFQRSVALKTQDMQEDGKPGLSNVSYIGLLFSLGILFLVIFGGVGLYCREKRKPTVDPRQGGSPSSRGSRTADDLESYLRRWNPNPAPRYSMVMESGDLYPTPARHKSTVFTIPVSPPTYTDALQALENRGFEINIEQLQPMPPSYDETVTSSAVDRPGRLGPQRHSVVGVHESIRL